MAVQKYIGPFRIDEVINNQYKIIRLLGQGGHAHVYECYDELLDAVVALKVIAPFGGSTELLKRAKAEAQVMFRLAHPNIVRVYSALVVDDLMCIVMEKLDGLTLRMMLALLGRLSVVEALRIVRQVAVGVGEAHKLNVVHRDIKPDNVFILPPDNSVKVLDFGIAKFMGHGLQTTNKDRLHGTPIYMSPEHLRCGKVTAQSDIYELGTVLFELIAGVNPCLIGGENYDAQQIGFVQISRVAPPLSTLVRGVSAGLDWLVQCAIAKDPSQRFANMDDMIQAIDRALAERLTSHPHEAENVRYVDETLMRAAKELASTTHPDDLLARKPPDDDSNQVEDRFELAATEAVKFFGDSQQPPRTVEQPKPDLEPAPYQPVRPKLAPTVEISSRSRGAVDTDAPQPADRPFPTTPPGAAPLASHPASSESLSSGPIPTLSVAAPLVQTPSPVRESRPPTAQVEPTIYQSSPHANAAMLAEQPLPTAKQVSALPYQQPRTSPARADSAPRFISPSDIRTATITRDPDFPISSAAPRSVRPRSPSRPSFAHEQATTPLVSVSRVPPSPRVSRRRPFSVTLFLTPVILGTAVGAVISLKWNQHDGEVFAASRTASSVESAVGSPPNELARPTGVAAARPSESSSAPIASNNIAGSSVPSAEVASALQSSRPKPVVVTKPSTTRPLRTAAFKPEPTPKVTKEELARMNARMKEFNDDVALELKGKGKASP